MLILAGKMWMSFVTELIFGVRMKRMKKIHSQRIRLLWKKMNIRSMDKTDMKPEVNLIKL